MNFWKGKQAESFVRQIIITGCQIMKGDGSVQMSENLTGWEEEGRLNKGMEIVFNWGRSHSFNLHKASVQTWQNDVVKA